MNLLTTIILISVSVAVTTCSIGMIKETDRATKKACYEQTKNDKCWEIKP